MKKYSPKQLIDDFVQQFSGSAESADHKHMRALLESLLRKLNLVTREEFDAQTAVLARTRKKLQALEKHVTELEGKINNPAASGQGID